jgi:CheY-like chemotaxis protein
MFPHEQQDKTINNTMRNMEPRFLLIDDEPTVLVHLTLLLKGVFPNSLIRKASSNGEAFAILDELTPDIITTDIVRPKGSGYEFLNAIRSHQNLKLRKVPIIAISGQGLLRLEDKEREELRQYRAGFTRVLQKPFDARELIRTIYMLLSLNLDPDVALIHLGTESQLHDYKERVDLTKKNDIAGFAKDVIAMANSGGGRIIIGVAERENGGFEPIGIKEGECKWYEVTNVNKALRAYLDPHVTIQSRIVTDAGKQFVFIEIPPAVEMPILPRKENEKANLRLGKLYIRNASCETSEIQNSDEMRKFIDRFLNYKG